jgi:hypothetical protein
VAFEFAQVVAQLVDAVASVGELDGGDYGLMDLFGEPATDVTAAVQEDFEQADDAPGKRIVEGGGIRLADEVRYIQHPAADYDGRIVTIGQLVLFSTETGDAWLLDRTDFLAARLARNGEAEPIQIVETAATFAIEWKGSYRINGPAFVYSDQDTGRAITILGYPTDKLVGVE